MESHTHPVCRLRLVICLLVISGTGPARPKKKTFPPHSLTTGQGTGSSLVAQMAKNLPVMQETWV